MRLTRLLSPLCLTVLLGPTACSSEPVASEAQAKSATREPAVAVKAGEGKVDEAKVDEAKTDEAKTDEAKTDEAKTDDTGEISPAVPAPTSPWASLVSASPTPSKAPAGSVLAKAHAHGKPVALITNDAGLSLVSLAGMKETLVAGAVDRAMYDARAGLVLLVRGDALFGLDLTAPVPEGATPALTELAKALPGGAMGAELLLVYPDRHVAVSLSDMGATYLRVAWNAAPELVLREAAYPGEDMSPPSPLPLVDSAWWTSRVDRQGWPTHKPANSALEFPYMPEGGKAKDPAFADRCFNYLCGAGLPLGVSGYELVVVGDDQGDFMHLMSVVHDPSPGAERWISMEGWTSGGAWSSSSELPAKLDELAGEDAPRFDASGEVFAPYTRDERLCTAQGKCQPAGGEVVDFLAGGVDVGPIYYGEP